MTNFLLWGGLTSTRLPRVYNHPPPPTPFTRCAHNHSKKGRTWAKTASSMPILICYVMILFSSLVFISFLSRHWVIPENIHTYTMDCFYDFGKGGGVHDYGILRAWGVFTIGNPKAWGNSTGGISNKNWRCILPLVTPVRWTVKDSHQFLPSKERLPDY